MKNSFVIVVALVLAFVLLAYSVAFEVRFDEAAVVTRFGRADEKSVYDGDQQAGLHFKLPSPIETVRTYDRRVQIYDDRPEEQLTLDNVAVVVQSYLAWRVTDPLAFYRSLRTVEEAEKTLRDKFRSARRVLGEKYNFEDLVNTDSGKLKLKEFEADTLARLNADLDQAEKAGRPYGVKLEAVGIKRILLAPKTTEAVFERMRKTRQRMAEKTLREGDSIATSIKAQAQNRADTIKSFASARAQFIRAQGDQAATEFLKVFSKDQNFAIQQRIIETDRAIFADAAQGKTTLIIDPRTNPLFKYLLAPPQAPSPAGGKVQATPGSAQTPATAEKK